MIKHVLVVGDHIADRQIAQKAGSLAQIKGEVVPPIVAWTMSPPSQPGKAEQHHACTGASRPNLQRIHPSTLWRTCRSRCHSGGSVGAGQSDPALRAPARPNTFWNAAGHPLVWHRAGRHGVCGTVPQIHPTDSSPRLARRHTPSLDETERIQACGRRNANPRAGSDRIPPAHGGLVTLNNPDESAYISYIAVVPDHRGNGYANDLVRHGTKLALEAGWGLPIRAQTDLINVPMRTAFTSHGY
ncbi:MAG: GNAT family N-acetyltransferase [Acidimicrobiia bacterium]|nr:GNAT family N-acetyltransferase [Acidimicrobiia bacterium]